MFTTRPGTPADLPALVRLTEASSEVGWDAEVVGSVLRGGPIPGRMLVLERDWRPVGFCVVSEPVECRDGVRSVEITHLWMPAAVRASSGALVVLLDAVDALARRDGVTRITRPLRSLARPATAGAETTDLGETAYLDDEEAPAPGPAPQERYEDRGLIGEGGMGVVRRVLDTRLGREVAMKSLPPALSDSDAQGGVPRRGPRHGAAPAPRHRAGMRRGRGRRRAAVVHHASSAGTHVGAGQHIEVALERGDPRCMVFSANGLPSLSG